jgi:hypothetical protein
VQNRLITSAAILLTFISWAVAPLDLFAQGDSGSESTCSDAAHVERTYRKDQWYVVETGNFQVCCEGSGARVAELARRAESLRTTLRGKWLGDSNEAVWNPRCQVFLYSNQRSYVAALGQGSEHTVGSSAVRIKDDRIVNRRVDLVGDDTQFPPPAMPHELTHVILRERFVSTPPPRWADEGMAMLADTDAKQNRHRADLRNSLVQRTTFNLAALVTMDEYPRPDRWGTFYGQSVSVTEFLVKQKTPEQFVHFIDRTVAEGYDAALRECYGIAGMAELDRRWRKEQIPSAALP